MPSLSEMPGDATGLSVSQLSIDFGRGRETKSIFKGFSLSASNGEVLAILGRSGSGKSTLLNTLAGSVSVQSGDMKFDNMTLAAARKAGLVSYQNQKPLLLPWLTLRKNYEIFSNIVPHQIGNLETILHRLGLGDVIDHYPNSFSGGMYQRAAFGRALYVNPRLLLIDEPFSALDEITRIKAYSLLREEVQQKQICCVMVTHDITETLRLADRCIVIADLPARVVLDVTIEDDIRKEQNSAMANTLRKSILEALT